MKHLLLHLIVLFVVMLLALVLAEPLEAFWLRALIAVAAGVLAASITELIRRGPVEDTNPA